MKAHLLLVEDDRNLGYVLNEYLSMHGYTITLAQDGKAGRRAFEAAKIDLCILDVMMPGQDGFALATELKALAPSVPIIFLTAKSLKVDKLKGFKLGADDYITKPVDEEELIARIGAVLYRTTPASHRRSPVYQLGAYTFDYPNQCLRYAESCQILTAREADMLKILCDHQGRVVERKMILHQLWGESDYFKRKSMDVFISRLRKHLRFDSSITIRNVHGKGFVLETRS